MMFPNVPDVPGVPPVNRPPGAPAPQPQVLTGDAPPPYAATPAQWGIFDQNGAPVVLADSVIVFDFRKEYRASNFPIENGAFASYNKVQMPFIGKMAFAKGGTDADRASFLASIQSACDATNPGDPLSLALFTIVTPEVSYPNVTLTNYDYMRRALNGVTLLNVDVWCEEVRPTAPAQFSSTQAPDGAGTVDDGQVQPVGNVTLGNPTWQ
jgi:hypothetical protein